MFDDFNEPSELNPPTSPPMKAQHPKFTKQSPTPPPQVTAPPLTFDPPLERQDGYYVHTGIAQNSSEENLFKQLDSRGHDYPAHIRAPRYAPKHNDYENSKVSKGDMRREPLRNDSASPRHQDDDDRARGRSLDSPGSNVLGDLAAKALAAAVTEPRAQPECPTNEISMFTRKLSIHEDKSQAANLSLSPGSHYHHIDSKRSAKSPQLLTPGSTGSTGSTGLPPISPGGSEPTQTLPSLRFHLGDIKIPLSDQDPASRRRSDSTYSHSSPGGHQLPPLSGGHPSPQAPLSPPDSYQKSLPSPHSFTTASPFAPFSNGSSHRPSTDLGLKVIIEPSSHERIPFTSSNAIPPVTDRMRIDDITNPQAGYTCDFSGCTAPPFQTQYLLNSHANVHSSVRPHYCPVQGCSRSEGGKGFKRKNEMIRHGLVHDSPGYICPFCPDRDHRYPRPDNLQRHVRVHHVDKSKDDPLLREVLSQRAEGPQRGRRRRGGPP